MKNVINYYYNLYPDKIFQNNNEFYFFINNDRYSFIKYFGDLNKITEIYNMHIDILNKKMYVHPIILNKDNKVLTFFNNEFYILMHTIYYGSKINLNNILSFSNIKIDSENKEKWGVLWSKKNDYLEYQMHMLGHSHPIIRDSFSYFMGLGETAIELANMVENSNEFIVYSHKRIGKNFSTYDLYNPLNIIVDLTVRDAAEYFKQNFFNNEDIKKELFDYLTNEKLSSYEYIMFLARMIYPTYYFDLYEEVITGRESDKDLIKIINLSFEYENILRYIYKFCRLFRIRL